MTKRQKEIIKFIKQYLKEHDYAASLDEIAKHVGFKTNVGALYHCKILRKDGFIDFEDSQPRTIHVINRKTKNIDDIECKENKTGPKVGSHFKPKGITPAEVKMAEEITKEVKEERDDPYA